MNVPTQIPHMRIVVAVSAFVLISFALISGYVIVVLNDKVSQGNIISTWQNFAVLAVGFWIGSSSAGKAKDSDIGPKDVNVVSDKDHPVHVEETMK